MDQFKEAGEFGLRKIGTYAQLFAIKFYCMLHCIEFLSYFKVQPCSRKLFCILDMLAKALYYTFHLNRQNKSNVPKLYLPLPTIFKKQTTNMYSGVF